ncbi:fibrinogen-like YCDxxxxGGGW domain-containing protein [Confluentibacter citreus]|uniref:fibrinogen-like YCDxxxxGGGW domain-containing protein n=1 Tax=Confluentibacter citreus TaxID=2007307 RepID=UPI000C2929BB|nr:fibrinogen-like YCDxxxxGGGW domain-containing protein [Confluentibacter citreus]
MVFVGVFFSGNAQTIPSGFNLIAYEGFNYTSGSSLLNANGGAGWTNPWTKAYMDRYLKTSTTGFTYPGLTTTGLKAEFDFSCYGSCNQIAALRRSIPLQSEGVVYFQFISVFEASGGGGTPQIRLYDGTTYTGMIGAGGGSFMSIYSLTNNSSSTSRLSAQNFVVVRIDYNLNKTEMWINPDLSKFNYLNPMSPSASILGFSPSFDRMDIYIRSGSIDEITVLSQTYVPTINNNGRLSINANEQVNQYGALASSVGLSVNGKIILSNLDGLTPETAGISAKQIKADHESSVDGIYYIKNSNINDGMPFQIYADMTTDGGGWMLLNVGAGTTAAPESNTLTSPDVLGYLPKAHVIEMAKLSTDVQLRAGNSSISYAHKTTSTSPLAIGALRSTATDVNGASTWANGASSTFVVNSGSWLWAYCCAGAAVGWPRMYHSVNYTNGVHWFADLGTGRKNSNPRDAWFSTWIR